MFHYPEECPKCGSKEFKHEDKQKDIPPVLKMVGGTTYFKCDKCKETFTETEAWHQTN